MEKPAASKKEASPASIAVEIAIRLGVLAVLLAWCFQILKPFISPVVWAIIIAIAVYPVFERLNARLGGRRKLTAAVLIVFALLCIILPGVQLAVSSVDSLKALSTKMDGGVLKIPPPPTDVESWPVIGKFVAEWWQKASENIQSILVKFAPQVTALLKWLLKSLVGTAVSLLMFAVSLIIAGGLMATAKSGGVVVRHLFVRLAGERGDEFAEIAGRTVRSVVKGIIGVAIVQSIWAGVGFVLAGIPGAGIWALLCLILAIIQIGIGPVIVPVIVYAFWKLGTLTAILLTVWLILAAVGDGPLKAVLLGRGAAAPMLVIFLGTLGGFISAGFLGLFIGPVVLSVGYRLFEAWLRADGGASPIAESSGSAE